MERGIPAPASKKKPHTSPNRIKSTDPPTHRSPSRRAPTHPSRIIATIGDGLRTIEGVTGRNRGVSSYQPTVTGMQSTSSGAISRRGRTGASQHSAKRKGPGGSIDTSTFRTIKIPLPVLNLSQNAGKSKGGRRGSAALHVEHQRYHDDD